MIIRLYTYNIDAQFAHLVAEEEVLWKVGECGEIVWINQIECTKL